MKVDGEEKERIVVTGDNGICISISDTEMGNLRVTEVGQFIKNLEVIPQASNCIVIKSSKEIY